MPRACIVLPENAPIWDTPVAMMVAAVMPTQMNKHEYWCNVRTTAGPYMNTLPTTKESILLGSTRANGSFLRVKYLCNAKPEISTKACCYLVLPGIRLVSGSYGVKVSG